MPSKRSAICKSLMFGFLCALLFTLAAMLALSTALVFMHVADQTLTLLNQFIKLIAIVLGVCIAVPRGGSRGFATGLLISIAYIAIGYALYVALGGANFSVASMLGELLMGSAVGAVVGAIRANLYPKRRTARV